MTGSRVSVGLILIFLRTGEALGLERSQLIERAGLAHLDLHDPNGYAPQAYFRALGTILLERHSPVAIGLAGSRNTDIGMLGLFGYVLKHSATLADALEQVIRYANIIGDPERWWTSTDAAAGRVHVGVQLAAAEEALGFPAVAQLASWILFSRVTTGTNVRPEVVTFRSRLGDEHAPLEAFFGCPVQLGGDENRMELAAQLLALPIRGALPELRPSLLSALQGLIAAASEQPDFRGRLRALLLQELPRGMTTRDEAARALAMSSRTLSRRLQAEGLSFREVLDDVRRELTLAWLASPANTINEIAFLLGYGEPSTLYRSFRRWTGHTPDAWRQQHRRPRAV